MKFEPLVESIARVRRLSRNARPALLRLRDTPQVRAPVLGRQAPGLALSGREEPALAHRRARDPPRQGRSPAQRAAQSPGTRRVTGMAGPPRRPPQQAERDQRPRVTSRTGEQLVGALNQQDRHRGDGPGGHRGVPARIAPHRRHSPRARFGPRSRFGRRHRRARRHRDHPPLRPLGPRERRARFRGPRRLTAACGLETEAGRDVGADQWRAREWRAPLWVAHWPWLIRFRPRATPSSSARAITEWWRAAGCGRDRRARSPRACSRVACSRVVHNG
jgi:hypothetical protein